MLSKWWVKNTLIRCSEDVIKEFHLNTEQERVFHVIVNHGVISNPEMFNMYLGEVGGTRKS
jgi:hypothetical protein